MGKSPRGRDVRVLPHGEILQRTELQHSKTGQLTEATMRGPSIPGY
jgi:hypothetical protein